MRITIKHAVDSIIFSDCSFRMSNNAHGVRPLGVHNGDIGVAEPVRCTKAPKIKRFCLLTFAHYQYGVVWLFNWPPSSVRPLCADSSHLFQRLRQDRKRTV